MTGSAVALHVPLHTDFGIIAERRRGLLRELSKRRLRHGVHSIVSLRTAINRFIAEANAAPRPFRWTKDPDKIIVAVRRGHQGLGSLRSIP